MNDKTYIPWVEKYRPNTFEKIVLDENNKTILNNIVKTNNFPNLLFYGPPGIGKTTTIINLIEKYKIQGFPSILLIDDQDNTKEFDGDRTVSGLEKFVSGY